MKRIMDSPSNMGQNESRLKLVSTTGDNAQIRDVGIVTSQWWFYGVGVDGDWCLDVKMSNKLPNL